MARTTQLPEPTPHSRPALRHDIDASDRDAVRRIVESTGFFRPDETQVALELVDERLRRGEASGYDFLFAELDGKVVGYACYGPIACTIGGYDLYWIAVDRQWQGKGVGQTLLGEVERRIRQRGGRQVYIETSGRAQYAPTRAFYERCGYQVAAVLADFYDRGDDKVVWRKACSNQGE